MMELYTQESVVGKMLFVVGSAVLTLGLFGSFYLISSAYTTEFGWMCLFGSLACGAHLVGMSEVVRLLSSGEAHDDNV